MCVLQQVTGVTEQRQQRLRWQVTVTAAEALPAFGLADGDDLGTQFRMKPNDKQKFWPVRSIDDDRTVLKINRTIPGAGPQDQDLWWLRTFADTSIFFIIIILSPLSLADCCCSSSECNLFLFFFLFYFLYLHTSYKLSAVMDFMRLHFFLSVLLLFSLLFVYRSSALSGGAIIYTQSAIAAVSPSRSQTL